MRGDRRRRASTEVDTCEEFGCEHGGRCERVAAGAPACACTGAWGGARCTVYVGHDHACRTRACPHPALCVWGPDVSATEAGDVRCVCPAAEECSGARSPVSTPGLTVRTGAESSSGGTWGVAVGALLTLLAAVLAALYVLQRRRRGAFVHARLSDNVEINNPMYLAGEDEPEPLGEQYRPLPAHAAHPAHNGSRQFANPVYDELYPREQDSLRAAPRRAEEHVILLREGSGEGSPPPSERTERAALL